MSSLGEGFGINIVDWEEYQAALLKVRYQVFVIEQLVPEEEEWDGRDDTAIHALASDSAGNPIGTGRLLPDGKIGRMAVLASWRRKSVGGRILTTLLQEAARRGHSRIELSAQISAIPFYERHGFAPYGEHFMDAGIPHRMMAREISAQEPT